MAQQRVQVADLESPQSLRSMAVGSYGVAVQNTRGEGGIRGFLSEFGGLAQAGVQLEAARSDELKEQAAVEVAKLTPEQLRKLQKGISPDVPLSSNPFVVKAAESAAGELAMRDALGGRISELARQGVRGGGDPMEMYNKEAQGVFKAIGSGYQAIGAKKIKDSYDRQMEAAIANEYEQLTRERIDVKLNKDVSAAINLANEGGFDEAVFKKTLTDIHSWGSSNGISVKAIGDAIAANISRIDDPDKARSAILAAQETVIDEKNGLTLGSALPATLWDSVEDKILREDTANAIAATRQYLSLDEFSALNTVKSVADAASSDEAMASAKASLPDYQQPLLSAVAELPENDNDGTLAQNAKNIEVLINQTNNSGAITQLGAYLRSGKVTKSDYIRLSRTLDDAYALRNVVSSRVDSVQQGLTAVAGGVKLENVEVEDMKTAYSRNLFWAIGEYRKQNPNATTDEVRSMLNREDGLVQKAITSTYNELKTRDNQIGAEKVRLETEKAKAEEAAKKRAETNIPMFGSAEEKLSKAQERRSFYTSKYEAAPQNITEKERYGFSKLYQWESENANELASSAANALNTGSVKIPSAIPDGSGGVTISERNMILGDKELSEAMVRYRSAKNTIGYTYNEVLGGVTRDGIALDRVMGDEGINVFKTLVVKDKAELNSILTDEKKLSLYKKKLGILNIAEFEKRQTTLLKLAGKE